ncbi:MAG: hypothetical protein ACOC04_03450 [Halothece sp.]
MKTKKFLFFLLLGFLLYSFISFVASFFISIPTLIAISIIILIVFSIILYIETTQNIDYLDIWLFLKSFFKIIIDTNPQTQKNIKSILKKFKFEKIKSKKVILEVNKETNFSLGSLGICKEINQNKNEVLVLFPTLTDNGDLEYKTFWYHFSNINIHDITNKETSNKNFLVMQKIAGFIQEQMEIEKAIVKQKEEQEKIKKLINLASSSKIYTDQINLYERAFSELQNLIDKGEKLKEVYFELVRENLIGKELLDYDPDQILNNHSVVESQYQQIREEYENLKDTATAYAEMLKGNEL